MRGILLMCLLVSIYSSTIILSPNNHTNSSQQTHTSDEYTEVNVNNLDDLHLFIESAIRDAVIGLENYLLVNVKQKVSDDNSSNTVYIYTFAETNNQSNSENNAYDQSSLTSFAVLGSNNNTQFIVYDGQNFSAIYKFSNDANTGAQAGGFSEINISQLNSDQLNALNFIVKNVPQLDGWLLVSGRRQVVAGINYCFDFAKDEKKSQIKEYCVWSQPWLDFLQLTLPDGTIITNTDTKQST